MIIFIYSVFILLFCINCAESHITNLMQTQSHHVIFDDLGKLSTGVTYINVAIPLNLTNYETQLNLFENYLQSINNDPPKQTNTA